VTLAPPSLTIGVEEEYLLVDIETGDLAIDPPEELTETCVKELGECVSHEFLRAQLEIGTKVCTSMAEVREDLSRLRAGVADVAARYGLAPVAASTHPYANWQDQIHTHKERYEGMAHDMQAVIQRMLICGMHVHIGIEDEDFRIDVLNQARYFLPHLLCLTTSSPFWQGLDTGLKCYRLAVFDSLPRTGLPDPIASWGEYQRMVAHMTSAGLIEDGTKIWWDIRPSARYPTVEMRICDVCTLLEDALTVASLYRCIVRLLYRLRVGNQRWREYPNMLIDENRWLAQRYGIEAELVDFGKRSRVPFAELMDELLDMIREDAEALDCVAEVERARTIARDGTSADRQLERFRQTNRSGDVRKMFQPIVDALRRETLVGVA
jgi:carboxylate-amine ligase